MNRSFFIIFAYFCTVKQKNRLTMEQLSKKMPIFATSQ